MKISDKEFAIINEISNNNLPDQRTLATKTGISLGLTNLIIRKLINKGYVKAKQLNHKKIQYLLTPKGFTEKIEKSYRFTLKTIEIIKVIRSKIQELILNEIENGATEFTICGNTEIANIMELILKDIKGKNIKYNFDKTAKNNSIILLIDNPTGKHKIDILHYLVNSGILYQ